MSQYRDRTRALEEKVRLLEDDVAERDEKLERLSREVEDAKNAASSAVEGGNLDAASLEPRTERPKNALLRLGTAGPLILMMGAFGAYNLFTNQFVIGTVTMVIAAFVLFARLNELQGPDRRPKGASARLGNSGFVGVALSACGLFSMYRGTWSIAIVCLTLGLGALMWRLGKSDTFGSGE